MTRNLINKKTTRKTKEVYFPCFTLKREDGEDMYDEIDINENNYLTLYEANKYYYKENEKGDTDASLKGKRV